MIAYVIVALVVACGVAVGLWRYELAQRKRHEQRSRQLDVQLRRAEADRDAYRRDAAELQRIHDTRTDAVARIERERAAMHAEVAHLAAGIGDQRDHRRRRSGSAQRCRGVTLTHRALLACALALACAPNAHAAERCTRYVDITAPCAGLAGPTARVVAGRAAVPALAVCRIDLHAEQQLRITDATAAAARIGLLERRLAALPLPVSTPPPVVESRTSPLVLVGVGVFIGALAVYGLTRWER